MTSIQIVLSDNKTNFVTEFEPTIQLDKPCEIALINLETYYSIPNIREGINNELRLLYNPSEGERQAWDFKIPTGSYDLVGINKSLEKIFEKEDLDTYPMNLEANHNTFKTIMSVNKDYVVDFTQNSLNKILGFEPKFYKEGVHNSENVIDILSVNSILVNLDIVSGSYVKGVKANTIYSFFPFVNPGHKIVERPPYPLYSPLLLQEIHSITAIITDQNGRQLDLRGENITMRFHIREIL